MFAGATILFVGVVLGAVLGGIAGAAVGYASAKDETNVPKDIKL